MQRPTTAAAVLSAALIAAAPAAGETLSPIGEFTLPTGLEIGGVPFGGISALDYDAASGSFVALSDDRAEFGPARYYRLAIDVSAEDGITGVDIRSVTAITGAMGAPFAPKGVDPEAMRLLPDGAGLAWAQERDENGVPSAGVMGLDGAQRMAFALPAHFLKPRVNLSLESLTLTADGTEALLAVESALQGDGPEATLEAGAQARMLLIDLADGRPRAEYVYPIDPVAEAPVPPDGFRVNGLVELLARPDGDYYALERSFSVGKGTVARLYRVTLAGATEVSGMPALAGADVRPVAKTRILELRAGGAVAHVDNLEAMSFGPVLADGRRTLILVSDNNFNPGQTTQFLAFAIGN